VHHSVSHEMDGSDFPIALEGSMVLILGETGSGKSFFVKKLTSDVEVKVGHHLESCTLKSQAFETKIGGTDLLIIDTPGFDDSIRSDSDVILEISATLSAQAALGVRLLGIIYMHDITVPRMRGSLRRELEMVRLIAGKRNYKHTLLVTTKWGDPSRWREFENRQFELQDNYWSDLIDGGAGVHRFEGSTDSARSIVAQLNFGVDVVLDLQKQLLATPDIEFRETPIGRFAELVRQDRQAELTQLTRHPQSARSNSTEVAAMQRSLQVSAADSSKLDIRLHQEIKDLVSKAIKEEKSSGRKKPSASRIITWVLTAAASAIEGMQKPRVPPK